MSLSLVRCLLVAGALSVCGGVQAAAFAEAEITAVRSGFLGQPLVDQGISFAVSIYSDQAVPEFSLDGHGWPAPVIFGQTLVFEVDYKVTLEAGTFLLPYLYHPECAAGSTPVPVCPPLSNMDNAWAFLSIGVPDSRVANPFVSQSGGEEFSLFATNGETLVRSGTVRVLLDLTSPAAPTDAAVGASIFVEAVGAIPEPETYALMLAGLLVMGAWARGRRAMGKWLSGYFSFNPSCCKASFTAGRASMRAL